MEFLRGANSASGARMPGLAIASPKPSTAAIGSAAIAAAGYTAEPLG